MCFVDRVCTERTNRLKVTKKCARLSSLVFTGTTHTQLLKSRGATKRVERVCGLKLSKMLRRLLMTKLFKSRQLVSLQCIVL